jgi:hypothetical protein
MPPRIVRITRAAVVTGLMLALLISDAVPLFANDVAARNRRGRTTSDVVAEEVQTFTNGVSITVVNGATTQTPITVSGFETSLADIDISLTDLDSTAAPDLDILLVGPSGQTALLVSDVGTTATDVNLTLNDQAANQISSFQAMTSGIFQPTNFGDGDTFEPPAPATPASGSELGIFNGTDPNGTWNLFVRDDDTSNGSTSAIAGGWSMTITSANGVPRAGTDQFQATAGRTLDVPADGVLGNDSDPDGDPLTAVLAGRPRQGSLTLQPNGSFSYRPNRKAKGSDSFTYLATDPGGLTALATVDIKVKKKKKRGRR